MSKDFIAIKNHGEWKSKSFSEYLKSLPDGRYKITISKSDKRTLAQSDWFHAVLPAIKDALRGAGFNDVRSNDDAKEVVKALFFKKEITNGIEVIPVIKGTSATSKLDFSARADEIIQWGREYLNIDIAPPGKQFEFFE